MTYCCGSAKEHLGGLSVITIGKGGRLLAKFGEAHTGEVTVDTTLTVLVPVDVTTWKISRYIIGK